MNRSDRAPLADPRLSPLEQDWLGVEVVHPDRGGRWWVTGLAHRAGRVWLCDGHRFDQFAVTDLRRCDSTQETLL